MGLSSQQTQVGRLLGSRTEQEKSRLQVPPWGGCVQSEVLSPRLANWFLLLSLRNISPCLQSTMTPSCYMLGKLDTDIL